MTDQTTNICDCELSHNGLGLAGRECDCPAGQQNNTTQAQDLERADVDKIWASADPYLVEDLAQAIARGCVAYDTRLPPGCLTAVTKSVLVTLHLRRTNADV